MEIRNKMEFTLRERLNVYGGSAVGALTPILAGKLYWDSVLSNHIYNGLLASAASLEKKVQIKDSPFKSQ